MGGIIFIMTKESQENKKAILLLVEALVKEGKIILAERIEKNWNKTCLEYSQELNSYIPDRRMEPEFKEAFAEELKRLDFDQSSREKILYSIEERRVLQTAPHLVVTEGPKMLCLNWLSSLGVPEHAFYIVGAFSGNPFSNSTRPGRVQTKDCEFNLIPSRMQDALVYRSKIPKELPQKMAKLPKEIKNLFFEKGRPNDSYTKWAIKSYQAIAKKALGRKNIVYVDINEVVSNYLAKVLKKESHLFYKIFFETKTRRLFSENFPNAIIFYTPAQSGKYEKMDVLTFSKKGLLGKKTEIPLNKPGDLVRELEENRICPGLLLVFIACSFLNRFKCLGSFAQAEYLPAYQKKLTDLSFIRKFLIENVPTSNLTTGIFPDDTQIFPVDLAIEGKSLEKNPNLLFGELLIGVKDRLVSSYTVKL